MGRASRRVRNRAELHARLRRLGRAAHAPAGGGRGLRRLRPLAVDRRRDDGHEVPARAADARPLRGRPRLPLARDRGGGAHDLAGSSTRSSAGSSTPASAWSQGTEVHPIDYANASPDVALTSLHYYFPWAITALLKWRTFCLVTGRRARLDLDTRRYFEIADRDDLDYREKLAAYRRLADEHFEADRYHDFCASRLGHVDELVLDWVDSAEFDRLLVGTVRSTYPANEHERFTEHLRGLVGQWVREQGAQSASRGSMGPEARGRTAPLTG